MSQLAIVDIEQALSSAESLRKQKQYQQAITLLVDALETRLQQETIYYRLGNIYVDAGRLDLAEYAYKRALEIDPNHLNAHFNLSVVYKKRGKVDASIKERRAAIMLEIKHGRQRKTLTAEQQTWAGKLSLRLFAWTAVVIVALIAITALLVTIL